MPRFFTNSELSTWRRCRRKWWFQYYRKLVPMIERLSESRDTGNVVHDVLAEAYETNWESDPVASVTWHCERLREQYQESETDLETIDKIEAYSVAIVEGYVQWLEEEGADQDYTLVDTEQEVMAKLTDDIYLLGKLDARFNRESDGARVFMDHKVVGNLTDFPKWAHLGTQFKFYHILERVDQGRDVYFTDGGVINMLRRVKRTGRANPPFYGRHEVRHNPEELNNAYFQFWNQIDQIRKAEHSISALYTDAATFMYPTPSSTCTWECPFFSACQMVDDGSDIEGFIEAAYREADPLERYQSLGEGS